MRSGARPSRCLRLFRSVEGNLVSPSGHLLSSLAQIKVQSAEYVAFFLGESTAATFRAVEIQRNRLYTGCLATSERCQHSTVQGDLNERPTGREPAAFIMSVLQHPPPASFSTWIKCGLRRGGRDLLHISASAQ